MISRLQSVSKMSKNNIIHPKSENLETVQANGSTKLVLIFQNNIHFRLKICNYIALKGNLSLFPSYLLVKGLKSEYEKHFILKKSMFLCRPD